MYLGIFFYVTFVVDDFSTSHDKTFFYKIRLVLCHVTSHRTKFFFKLDFSTWLSTLKILRKISNLSFPWKQSFLYEKQKVNKTQDLSVKATRMKKKEIPIVNTIQFPITLPYRVKRMVCPATVEGDYPSSKSVHFMRYDRRIKFPLLLSSQKFIPLLLGPADQCDTMHEAFQHISPTVCVAIERFVLTPTAIP